MGLQFRYDQPAAVVDEGGAVVAGRAAVAGERVDFAMHPDERIEDRRARAAIGPVLS